MLSKTAQIARRGGTRRLAGIAMTAAVLVAGSSVRAEPRQTIEPMLAGTRHDALFALAAHGGVVIAVGTSGAILESNDEGRSWKAVAQVPTPLALLGVAMAQDHAVAVGQLGTVLVMDAGGHWAKAASGTDARLFGIGVNAKGLAVAVGAFGTMIKSADGGRTWASIAPDWIRYTEAGVQPHLYAVSVDDAGTITAVGEFGLILRSSDGGVRWQQVYKGDASLFALDLHDPRCGFAVGQSGAILRTTNGGASWTPVGSGSGAILLGVHAAGNGRVLATGMRELLESRDGGLSWNHIARGEATTSWYQGITQVGSSVTVLAVGHSGQIVRVGG